MLSQIWGWTVLACPVACIAGFVWIGRASELEAPLEGVPSVGGWLLISLGTAVVFVFFGFVLFAIGLGHGGAPIIASVVMYALIIGPFIYCFYAFKWISRVRRKLKEQRLAPPEQ